MLPHAPGVQMQRNCLLSLAANCISNTRHLFKITIVYIHNSFFIAIPIDGIQDQSDDEEPDPDVRISS